MPRLYFIYVLCIEYIYLGDIIYMYCVLSIYAWVIFYICTVY